VKVHYVDGYFIVLSADEGGYIPKPNKMLLPDFASYLRTQGFCDKDITELVEKVNGQA
jgi:hypothetical protein